MQDPVNFTKDENADAESSARRRKHQSGSFLVRFWVESSAGPEEQAMRGCVKNLQTGEEQYVSDPKKIADLVLQHLSDPPEKPKEAGEENDDPQPER